MPADLPDEREFAELMQRVRAGDQEAATRCVRIFEPEIRRAIRVRLNDPRLRQFVDSIDICQSVFGRFFQRAIDDQFDMARPEQMLGLLLTMARNRLVDIARRQQAQRRDVQRNRSLDDTGAVAMQPVDRGPGPSSIICGEELFEEVKRRLRPGELSIALKRSAGASWEEIADACGEQPDAVRKRFNRAIDRIRQEMGVD